VKENKSAGSKRAPAWSSAALLPSQRSLAVGLNSIPHSYSPEREMAGNALQGNFFNPFWADGTRNRIDPPWKTFVMWLKLV
jgi:hypothetical protein